MRPRTVLFVLVLSFMITGKASAQQQKGDVELQLQGSYYTTFATDVAINVGTIAGKFAPFLTDNLQIGVGPTLTITTTKVTTTSPLSGQPETKSDTRVTFGSTVFATYSFLTKGARTVPYAGVSWYKVDFSKGSQRGWVGVNGGARYFLTRRTSLDLSASFLKTITEGETGSMVLFAFGLSFLV